jgi:hypothetical protein
LICAVGAYCSFYDNFDMEKGVLKNEALAEKLKAIIAEL